MNIEDYFNTLGKISKKFEIDLLVLFGSFATGDNNQNSDIDLAYFSKKKINDKDFVYEIIKQTNLDNIDIVEIKNTNSVELNWNIFKNGIKIYQSTPSLFDNLLTQSFINYVDFKKYLEVRDKILDNKIDGINTDNYTKKIKL